MADFSVDFSPIANLGKTYQDARMRANRERTLADLGRGANVADVSRALFQAGDIQGGLSLANLANAQSQQDWTRTYQGGMLDLARQNAQRREEPDDIRKLRAAGINPQSPEGRKALFPRTDTPISATDKKAIFEAEDTVPQLQGTIEALDKALELNGKTYTGFGAEFYGNLGAKASGSLGMTPSPQAAATVEWQKIMGPEALQTMANTLKGATTDFELRKYLDMLADPSTPVETRSNVIKRMKTLAERKMELNQSRIRDLRGGDYFKPGGGMSPAKQTTDSPARAMPAGARQAPDGNYYVPDPNRPGKYLQVR